MAGHNPALAICGRLYVLFLGLAAIAASVLLAFSCQMFSYRTTDGEVWEGFNAPFDQLSSASVGLFSYSEVTTAEENVIFGDECAKYDSWQDAGQSIYFSVAQGCSLLAPLLGFLAWIQVILDLICCRLCGGFALISLLFFAASAAQAATFLVFADSDFCFEANSFNKCHFELGAWYSLGAAIVYLVLAVIAPLVPVSPNEERKGCCYVKGKPKKGEEATSSTSTRGGQKKEVESQQRSVQRAEDVESVPDYLTDDDEKTTNTNQGGNTTIAEEDNAEEEGGGLCNTHFFDNICGKNEEGTEVLEKKDRD